MRRGNGIFEDYRLLAPLWWWIAHQRSESLGKRSSVGQIGGQRFCGRNGHGRGSVLPLTREHRKVACSSLDKNATRGSIHGLEIKRATPRPEGDVESGNLDGFFV